MKPFKNSSTTTGRLSGVQAQSRIHRKGINQTRIEYIDQQTGYHQSPEIQPGENVTYKIIQEVELDQINAYLDAWCLKAGELTLSYQAYSYILNQKVILNSTVWSMILSKRPGYIRRYETWKRMMAETIEKEMHLLETYNAYK